MLKKVYTSIMQCAHDNKLTSIAIPCISTGYFGFPMLPAARIAISTVCTFLRTHDTTTIEKVTFVVFNDTEYRIYQALMAKPRRLRIFKPLLNDESPCVLIIDQNPQNNWYAAFRNKACFNGRVVRCEQTAWSNIVCSRSHPTEGCIFDLEPTPEAPFGTSQSKARSVKPHLVIVRNFARGAKDEQYFNHLLVLQQGGVPTMNSVDSLLSFYHRANAIHHMNCVEQRIGDPSIFQAVPIDFHSNLRELYLAPCKFPLVAKYGSAHAGAGKMRFLSADGFDDFHGLVSMSKVVIGAGFFFVLID